MTERQEKVPGWGWPIALVVVFHLGLAVIPIDFSQAHSEERTTVELAMVTPPVFEEAQPEPEPEPIAEAPPEEPKVEPEPVPEPEPEPQPAAPVQAAEPENSPVPSEVAVREEPPVEEPEVETPEVEEVEEVAESEPVDEPEPVEEIAELEPEPEPVEAEPAAEPMDWVGYGRNVLRAVEAEKNIPRMAERMGWEGTAIVRVTVGANGQLAARPEILESTNHEILDDEVRRMVEAAAPFEAFPEAADRDERSFNLTVNFIVEG